MRWLRRLLGAPKYHRLLDTLTSQLQAAEHDAAAATATECVALAESLHGADHVELIGPLYASASARLVLGQHEEAASASTRAIAIAADATAPFEPPLHQLWEQRAAIADRADDRETFEHALLQTVEHAVNDPASRAAAHNRLGLLLGRAERFEDAAQHFDKALDLRRRDGDTLEVAEVLHNQATFRDPNATAPDEALDHAEAAFDEALNIAARHLTPQASALEARIAHNFAVLKQERLDTDEAERLYRQALAAFERDHSESDPVLRPTLARLGRLLQAARRFDEAVDMLTQAHAIAEQELGGGHDITGRLALWLGDANSHTYR